MIELTLVIQELAQDDVYVYAHKLEGQHVSIGEMEHAKCICSEFADNPDFFAKQVLEYSFKLDNEELEDEPEDGCCSNGQCTFDF